LSGFFKKESIFYTDLTFSRWFWQTNEERDYLNQKRPGIIENLAFLSVKHNVFLAELYQAIVSARIAGKSLCGELSIEYRGRADNEEIFLITREGKVIVQFRVGEDFLSRDSIRFDGWMDTDKVRKQLSRQHSVSPHLTLVQNLRHGMKKVNVEAEVVEKQKPQLVHTQFGNSVLLTKAVVSDETGKIKLSLWGEQSDLADVGDIVQIKNATVRTFKGERQLSIGRNGTISVQQSKAEKHATIIAAS
jgi:replication factor A1